MKSSELNKFKKVLSSIAKEIDVEDRISINIKERLDRIINEVEFCVTYSAEKKYLPLQQFRILMDKIVNVIQLRDMREKYLEYLELLEEYENVASKREFLCRNRIEPNQLMDREKFLKNKLNGNQIEIDSIREYKYHVFKYWIGFASNDSSRVIHDDNSTYRRNVPKKVLAEIEQIILFFISNIFISFCGDKENKEYLRSIHKLNKKRIRNNSSISKKNINMLKKVIRGVA